MTTAHPIQLSESIKKGLSKKGFSFIEVIAQCPTYYGRFNISRSAVEVLKYIRDHSIHIKKAENLPEEELRGKIVIGEFLDIEKPEFIESMLKLIEEYKG